MPVRAMYSKSELLELTFQDITHPDDLKKDLSLIRKILNKKIETYTLEKRYLSKSGDIIWVSLTTSPVWNTDNTIKFFIAQVVDITARKKLTTELHNKNIELARTFEKMVRCHQVKDLCTLVVGKKDDRSFSRVIFDFRIAEPR